MALVFAFGIFGEPAFLHALALGEELQDAPQGGEGEDARQCREKKAAHAERRHDAPDAEEEEEPPAARPPMVFRPDDDGMEEPDDEEGGDAYQEAGQMMCFDKSHIMYL